MPGFEVLVTFNIPCGFIVDAEDKHYDVILYGINVHSKVDALIYRTKPYLDNE